MYQKTTYSLKCTLMSNFGAIIAFTSAITGEIHIVADYLLNSKLYGVSSAVFWLSFWEKVAQRRAKRMRYMICKMWEPMINTALCSKGWHLKKKKSYHEMFNFENWFLCQFSSNTRFSFGGGSLNTPKIGNHKKEFTNINLSGYKTQKT